MIELRRRKPARLRTLPRPPPGLICRSLPRADRGVLLAETGSMIWLTHRYREAQGEPVGSGAIGAATSGMGSSPMDATAHTERARAVMRYGKKAWAGLGVYLAVVELAAPQGETLSEAMDEWLERHPAKALCYMTVAVTAAHLLNLIPQRYDPIHQVFSLRQHLQRSGISLDI